jgi:hypothetical protein
MKREITNGEGTPAMAAKVASHPCSVEELYERVMGTVEVYGRK